MAGENGNDTNKSIWSKPSTKWLLGIPIGGFIAFTVLQNLLTAYLPRSRGRATLDFPLLPTPVIQTPYTRVKQYHCSFIPFTANL